MVEYPYRSTYTKKRLWLLIKVVPFVLLIIAAIFGVAQLPAVREFFGKASGEPANIQVDVQAVLGPMPRPWRNLAQGGEESNWRLGSLVPAIKALKPQYIRIDHIYDFYDIVKGTPGNLTFDFSKLDPLIDDITATGAKPYIALSYMPPAISSGDILAVPKQWSDWQLTVQKTIEHISGTKGITDAYYEVWNEPDLFGNWKYYGDKNYLTLYSYAAKGAQQARGVRAFKIGGPAITALYKTWFDSMMKFVIANNLRMDFFSWHRYNLDLDVYKKDMTDAKNWLQAYPQLESTMELHITEWGHDSNVHAGYDNNFGAAHTVAGAIEMIGVVDRAFVFEIQDGKSPENKTYWGRWGLFTNKDFGSAPKPRYSGLRMLDRIGNQRLQLLGKGTWVKAAAAIGDNGNPQVILSNFDRTGHNIENVPITFLHIQPGQYTVTKEFLGGRKQTEDVATSEATLQVHVSMSPNTVSFVELQKK